MKKLLLAVAVSAAASSTSAVTVYEGNGFTYKLNGDLQVQLRQKVGNDKEPDVEGTSKNLPHSTGSPVIASSNH